MPTKLNNSAAVATLMAICMMAGIARGDEQSDDPCNANASFAGDDAAPATAHGD